MSVRARRPYRTRTFVEPSAWADLLVAVEAYFFDPHGAPPRFETFFQRLHPDDQAKSRERFEKAICDKADFEFGYRVVHPDKGVRNIHVVGHAVLDQIINEYENGYLVV
jgi:hypothetical protein